MPSAREYLRNKKKRSELHEFKNKLFIHKLSNFVRIIIIIALLIIGGIVFFVSYANRVYDEYDVISSAGRADSIATQYEEFAGNILKYSKDGASYVALDNSILWNQTYEMQEPIIDICEEYLAIGDEKGNKIYIFNTEGLQGEIDTLLPIWQIEISNQGMVVAVLEDDDINWINYYDKEGTLIADSKTTMENSGYPLDISISNDGVKLAVSYLYVNNGSIKSNVAFYNFGSVGQNEIDNLVSGYEYQGTVIPTVKFLSSNVAVAFGDDKVTIYEGKQKPSLINEIPLEEEVKSIFWGEQYFGFVFNNSGTEEKYRMCIYNLDGKLVLDKYFDMEYETIKIVKNEIILFSETECMIYNIKGVEKFHKTFEMGILNIIPKDGFRKYIIINSSNIEEIKLK